MHLFHLLLIFKSFVKFSRDFSGKFMDLMPEAPVETESGIYLSDTNFTAEQLKIKARIWNKRCSDHEGAGLLETLLSELSSSQPALLLPTGQRYPGPGCDSTLQGMLHSLWAVQSTSQNMVSSNGCCICSNSTIFLHRHVSVSTA